MTSNKLNEYKKMDIEALKKELKELKSELFKLRLAHAMNGLDNPNKIKETKKNIARVNTLLTKRNNGEEVVIKESVKKEKKEKKEKKVAKKDINKEPKKEATKKTAKKEAAKKEE